MYCGLSFALLALSARPAIGACDFRAPLANEAPVGAISSIQTGNVVSSITLRFSCTQGNSPAFDLRGSNDTGPGLHRMRNLNQTTEYLPYRTTTSLSNPTSYLITITVTEADYRDAWVGPYEDTLFITVTP